MRYKRGEKWHRNFKVAILTEKKQTITKKIQINKQENQNLISMRDTLLPKLLSGEIRVEPEEEIGG